jgi:hypothetical protein
MRSKFALLLVAAAAVAGCSYHPAAGDLKDRGVEEVNVPVVTRAGSHGAGDCQPLAR